MELEFLRVAHSLAKLPSMNQKVFSKGMPNDHLDLNLCRHSADFLRLPTLGSTDREKARPVGTAASAAPLRLVAQQGRHIVLHLPQRVEHVRHRKMHEGTGGS